MPCRARSPSPGRPTTTDARAAPERRRVEARVGSLTRVLSRALLALAPVAGFAAPSIGGCPVFPADNVWNVRVDTLPVHPQSDARVATIGAVRPLHPDFGTFYAGAPNGIAFVVVQSGSAGATVTFDFDDESDPGPYPIPPDPPIEGGSASNGDRHALIVEAGRCRLYELYAAWPNDDGTWRAGSGAIFDLARNALRPATWTSADAAGLAILPGLARFDEAAAGEVAHALRFTAPQTRAAFVWPARHEASSLDGANYPPMGQRFRLKAGVDVAGFPASVQPILRALKRYGMMLADNGSPWYLSGAPDPRWNDDELHALAALAGADFEAVDVSSLGVDPDAGATRAGTPAGGRTAIEFHRASADHSFVSSDAAEIAALDAGVFAGWTRTGESFGVEPAGTRSGAQRTPVCRFYGRPEAGLDSHFFSASPAECRQVIDRYGADWQLESPEVFVVALPDAASGACPTGTVPLYRVFNGRRDANHRYTVSPALRARMVAAGGIAEGYGPDAVAMCAPAPP
ncbi:hypothetical protein BURK1_02330 [Burkholderiales bacterium]|nr:hypothetical protein BURK1_02330 [Burkholderiales bacterium]